MIKKMKKSYFHKVTIIFFLVTLGLISVNVETANGQVSTPSGITFVKDDEEPTTKPKEPKKTIIDSEKRSLPKTGEVITKASLYGVSLIILGSIYWIVLRRRRRRKNEA